MVKQKDKEKIAVDTAVVDERLAALLCDAIPLDIVLPSDLGITTNIRDPRKNKTSNFWGNLFCIASIVLTFIAMYFASKNTTGEEIRPFGEIIKGINAKYLLLSVAAVVVIMFLDSLKYAVIMHAVNVKVHYPTALKVALLGKYYDDITPFSSGGQPMQIYYLYKKGLHGGQSTGVVMVKLMFNMTMWLLLCLGLMVFNKGVLLTYVTGEKQLQTFTVFGWVGFGVNCCLPLAILLVAIFPKFCYAVTNWVLKVGQKLKIVKDSQATFNRAKSGIEEFESAFVSMVKKPFHSLLLLILCFAEPFLSMMLPYLVVLAIGGSNVVPSADLMFAIMTLNVYVAMSATIIPTPGNLGAIETAFMMTLTTIAEGTLFWTVFSWRFLSFYIYILIGLGMTIFQMVRKNQIRKILKMDI